VREAHVARSVIPIDRETDSSTRAMMRFIVPRSSWSCRARSHRWA
jgi:hypothetical protein